MLGRHTHIFAYNMYRCLEKALTFDTYNYESTYRQTFITPATLRRSGMPSLSVFAACALEKCCFQEGGSVIRVESTAKTPYNSANQLRCTEEVIPGPLPIQ